MQKLAIGSSIILFFAATSLADETPGDGALPQENKIEKANLIEETLTCLEGYLPGIRGKLDHVEAATPRTFEFYTQTPSGTSFGTKFEGLGVSMTLHEEIRGLFHAGSVGIILSGWLGAANYGAIAANKIDAYLHSLRPAPVPS